ncbi:uncharacterized protein H6S33_004847 [Morchella sextelata]|uniref:uncharacterized protein n=1 Tax=Morchella sextelata TaxID=1174677 RepID=UPI001D04BC6A|nr:uncharacterized protein H6S33_004847 [Morchella sextelata]KAH0605625.1 hypothetical protein H6S33_004847 [Morchella sextelata]
MLIHSKPFLLSSILYNFTSNISNNSTKIPALPCKLSNQGHYTVWRDLTCRTLKVHDLWNLVNGTSKHPVFTTTITTVTAGPPAEQPVEGVAAVSAEEDKEKTTDNTEEISELDNKDNLTVIFLQFNIEFEFILKLTLADTAHHLWT